MLQVTPFPYSSDFIMMITLPTYHAPTHATSHSFYFIVMLTLSTCHAPMYVTGHVFLICSYVMTAIILHICQLPMHATSHVHLTLFWFDHDNSNLWTALRDFVYPRVISAVLSPSKPQSNSPPGHNHFNRWMRLPLGNGTNFTILQNREWNCDFTQCRK
jgi:hypothetical protein